MILTFSERIKLRGNLKVTSSNAYRLSVCVIMLPRRKKKDLISIISLIACFCCPHSEIWLVNGRNYVVFFTEKKYSDRAEIRFWLEDTEQMGSMRPYQFEPGVTGMDPLFNILLDNAPLWFRLLPLITFLKSLCVKSIHVIATFSSVEIYLMIWMKYCCQE